MAVTFLSECRDVHDKENFTYLRLSPAVLGAILRENVAPCLRGVSQFEISDEPVSDTVATDSQSLDVLSSLLPNLRNIHYLCIPLYSFSCLPASEEALKSLRGIRELKLYDCDFTEVPHGAFENFRGVRCLLLSCCYFAENAPLIENLRGIENLQVENCHNFQFSDVEKRHLRGVKRLCISDSYYAVSDEDLGEFRGVEELDLVSCGISSHGVASALSDEAFKNLRGVKKLALPTGPIYSNVTNDAFKNLRGIRCAHLGFFPQITEEILENLRGIDSLYIESCPNIAFTSESLVNLRGIMHLQWMTDCEKRLNAASLKHLCGVRNLFLYGGVVTESDDAFRYLHSTEHIILYGEENCPKSKPLSEKAFSHLKRVESMTLDNLRLDAVSSFMSLVHTQMPHLKSFYVQDCRVLRSSLSDPKLGQVKNLSYGHMQEESDEYAVVSFCVCRSGF